jgi:hypothetical protein
MVRAPILSYARSNYQKHYANSSCRLIRFPQARSTAIDMVVSQLQETTPSQRSMRSSNWEPVC